LDTLARQTAVRKRIQSGANVCVARDVVENE